MTFIPAAKFNFRRLLGAAFLITVAVLHGAAQTNSALTASTSALFRGEFLLAAELAEKHLRQHPGDAPTRVILARAELAQGKFPRALQELQKAIQSDPRNVDAHYYLALVARVLSQREYERLFSIAPDSARVHQLMGEAALAAEKDVEAEAEFQAALRANPRSVEVLTELGELKRARTLYDEAIEYYSRAEQIGPLDYDIAYGLGACYLFKHDYERAAKYLRRAAALDPDAAAGRFALGDALFHLGQIEAAIPELKASLALEPKLKQAHYLLGRIYQKQGRTEEARAAFKKVDDLNRHESVGRPAP